MDDFNSYAPFLFSCCNLLEITVFDENLKNEYINYAVNFNKLTLRDPFMKKRKLYFFLTEQIIVEENKNIQIDLKIQLKNFFFKQNEPDIILPIQFSLNDCLKENLKEASYFFIQNTDFENTICGDICGLKKATLPQYYPFIYFLNEKDNPLFIKILG